MIECCYLISVHSIKLRQLRVTFTTQVKHSKSNYVYVTASIRRYRQRLLLVVVGDLMMETDKPLGHTYSNGFIRSIRRLLRRAKQRYQQLSRSSVQCPCKSALIQSLLYHVIAICGLHKASAVMSCAQQVLLLSASPRRVESLRTHSGTVSGCC